MASDSGDRLATLKRCLSVLRDARNDSEQFAALLLVRTRGIASGEGKGEAKHPAAHGSARGMWGGGLGAQSKTASELWGSLQQSKRAWP